MLHQVLLGVAAAENATARNLADSATISDYDADFDTRGDEWFVGADWIADAVAAPAQPARGGFFHLGGLGFGR